MALPKVQITQLQRCRDQLDMPERRYCAKYPDDKECSFLNHRRLIVDDFGELNKAAGFNSSAHMDQDHRDHWRFTGLSCIAASNILQDIGEPVRHIIREENELVAANRHI